MSNPPELAKGRRSLSLEAPGCPLAQLLPLVEREAWDKASAVLAIVFDPARNASSRLIGLAEFNTGLVAEGKGEWREANRRFQASFDMRVANGQHALVLDSLAGLRRVATAEHGHAYTLARTVEIGRRVETRGLDGAGQPGLLFVSSIGAWLELGDCTRAKESAREGVAFVNERAARLADPAHRRSYLTQVSAHRTLFAQAAELGIATG